MKGSALVMNGSESRLLCIVFRFVTSLMVLLIFMPAFPSYALDSNYVISEYNGWIDIDKRIDYEKKNDGFDGFLKRISDSESGCFYMYFSFYDTELEGYDDDNIVISFDVRNDINNYHFSVSRNGFVNTGDDEQKNIRLVYNFDNCSGSRCGGEIFIAFELINSIDRTQRNHISCEYAGGSSKTSVLFYDLVLDMYTETTAEDNSVNHTASKSSATERKTTTHKSNDSESKTEVKEKSTKYTPTGTLSQGGKTHTSKFIAGETYSSEMSHTDNADEQQSLSSNTKSQVGMYKMSKTAVITLSAAGVMIIIGMGFIIAGAAIKSKKTEVGEESDSSNI